MAIRNTYYGGGTNWSAGNVLSAADLNDTINATLMSNITRTYSNDQGGTNTTTSINYLTLYTPVAVQASQTVFVEASGFATCEDGTNGAINLVDLTSGATLAGFAATGYAEFDGGTVEGNWFNLMATVVISAAGATKHLALTVRRESGDVEFTYIWSAKLTCQLVTS